LNVNWFIKLPITIAELMHHREDLSQLLKVKSSRQTTSNHGSLRLLSSKSLHDKIIVVEDENFPLRK
jgi:hypothetical protein